MKFSPQLWEHIKCILYPKIQTQIIILNRDFLSWVWILGSKVHLICYHKQAGNFIHYFIAHHCGSHECVMNDEENHQPFHHTLVDQNPRISAYKNNQSFWQAFVMWFLVPCTFCTQEFQGKLVVFKFTKKPVIFAKRSANGWIAGPTNLTKDEKRTHSSKTGTNL